MLVYILILSCLIVAMLLLGREERVGIVYAGKPEEEKSIKKTQEEWCDVDFVSENGTIVELKAYKPFLVKGTSLEPEGISDGTKIFVEMLSHFKKKGSLENFVQGQFIVLKNDAKRAKKEYPERKVLNGLKIRKFIMTIERGLSDDVINGILNKLEENISEALRQNVLKKYKFVCDYYKKDEKFLLSVTYKDGKNMDFSFHSTTYLRGVVKYVTV